MHRHRASSSPFLPVPAVPGIPHGVRSARGERGARGVRAAVRIRPGVDLVEFEELAHLVADDTVTDVLVQGGAGVWADRGDGLVDGGIVLGEARTRELAGRLVASGGRHVDETTPIADVRHGDGIRVHVVLAPIAVRGTAISIRLPRAERPTIADLERSGTFDRVGPGIVADAVRERHNVLVSGATGSGKTTLLAAMLALVPHDERIVTVEDVAELRIDHPHVVALESRQANTEGAGALGLDRLVRESLRMRPDRVVVGECRGAEVRELMSALNTGHDGGAGTLHANGIEDVPARLEALGALAGLEPSALARQAVSAFDLVLHVERRRGVRQLVAAGRLVVDPAGQLAVERVAGSAGGGRVAGGGGGAAARHG
ncbi:TadA family conjugal transfer-associated ATPase [Curtobacterium sp. ZW137]|uniref:TadA family conjugal transfer-associated ATPase n=1 Tax=Curtobacterium sp. ZW137 TaxID=2485104 RepID=UPI000F4C2349|nr:TadA family conjugal transfer-associated ATPase [Curtobacterium sp. ZW137]